MKRVLPSTASEFQLVSAVSVCVAGLFGASAFEGRITAALTQGGQVTPLLYTVGSNFWRMEVTATNWPYPVDILDRASGELTLLFPHNRSFVRLKPADFSPAPPLGAHQMLSPPSGLPSGIGPTNLPGMPAMPQMPQIPAPPQGLPPGIGPQAANAGNGALPAASGAGALPMPMMPMPMMEKIELKATGDQTNLLGFACEKYELKQRRETMEIWATAALPPFQDYVRNQPHRFGPRMIEEQWGGLLKARKLFPLLAVLKFENGPERWRFEVKSVTGAKIPDPDGKLFQPPPDYHQVEPLPL